MNVAYEDFFGAICSAVDSYEVDEIGHDVMYDTVMDAVDRILAYRQKTGDKSIGSQVRSAPPMIITVDDVAWAEDIDEQGAAGLSTRHVAVALDEARSSQGGWPTLKLTGEINAVRRWLLKQWDDTEAAVDHVMQGATELLARNA